MVESQPPDWLGYYQQGRSSGNGARRAMGAVQWLEGLDNVWPSCVPRGLDIDKEVQGLSAIGIEYSIVSRRC